MYWPRTGDVPLFVEHCEAAAAEVDVTRRWLDEQGRRKLSFSYDALAERYGVPEVACAPSIVGSLLRLPAWPPRSSAGPSRPIAIASRCGICDILHDVGACERAAKFLWQAESRDGEDLVEALQNARRHARSVVFQPAREIEYQLIGLLCFVLHPCLSQHAANGGMRRLLQPLHYV